MGGVVAGQGSSAAEALGLVERSRPDVVILAVGLPDSDGGSLPIEHPRKVAHEFIRVELGVFGRGDEGIACF